MRVPSDTWQERTTPQRPACTIDAMGCCIVLPPRRDSTAGCEHLAPVLSQWMLGGEHRTTATLLPQAGWGGVNEPGACKRAMGREFRACRYETFPRNTPDYTSGRRPSCATDDRRAARAICGDSHNSSTCVTRPKDRANRNRGRTLLLSGCLAKPCHREGLTVAGSHPCPWLLALRASSDSW